jgi:hypothetical protein
VSISSPRIEYNLHFPVIFEQQASGSQAFWIWLLITEILDRVKTLLLGQWKLGPMELVILMSN